ncbi:MAG: ATP-binding protein [Bacilli bacterium]|nr:ATP-binding protein [Bacilli bacterium]
MSSMNLKSQLAPKGLQFYPSEFFISDKYSTILTVVAFPKFINPGYLSGLTNMSGIKIVIKHIPVPFSVISKMLNKQIVELKAKYQDERDRTMQERIRLDYESLESFVTMLAGTQAKIFDFQMHIMISDDTKEGLELKKTNVKNYLDAMGMRGVALRFEQEKALKSIIPIFPKQDIEDRIGTPIPSVTIAAMYPFIFDSIKDPGYSALLGVDFSGGVILFNQFLYKIKKENNRNNANLILLGTSGSGKSTAAKLLLRNHIRNGCQIVAIDPENELEEMTKTFGGDSIDLGKGGEYGMINPLQIVIDADEEEIRQGLGYTVLTRTLQFLKAFMKYYDPSIEEDVLTLFSEVVQDTYKRFGIDFDKDFYNFTAQDYPTFSDVYETIKAILLSMTDHTHERDIMERLELKVRPLTKDLKYYFDGHTTITHESDFITFNIKELMNAEENIKNALFFNILKYAWGLCLDKEVDTILMVDEAHVILGDNNTLGADFLAQVQRRARKYNTGTIIITQQPSDFATPAVITQGKAIFDNASYYLIMGLKKQATEDLSLLIDLNDNEKESIKQYSQGEALFVCGNRRMRINVVVTPEELSSFGSGGGL